MSPSRQNDENRDERLRELEQDIRSRRRFGLSEALGRSAGGNLKGASPVPRSRQALMDLEALLEARLHDPDGSLRRVLVQQLADNPRILEGAAPVVEQALATWLRQLLESPARLAEMVRQADMRWGRDYQERPRFNSPDHPDHPDDPYTPDSVRQSLQALLELLT